MSDLHAATARLVPGEASAVSASFRTELVETYQALGRAGLIFGNSGNVSVRSQPGMLISPTGTTPETITGSHVVQMGLEQAAPGASSEWALHAALYRTRPEIQAIVHTHADACTALACLGEDLPPFHYEILSFGGPDVRCAPYATFGTPELAAQAALAMQDRTACLLANHGMIAAGHTLAAATTQALRLERLCRQYLLARAAGSPRLLTPAQLEAAEARFGSYHADAA